MGENHLEKGMCPRTSREFMAKRSGEPATKYNALEAPRTLYTPVHSTSRQHSCVSPSWLEEGQNDLHKEKTANNKRDPPFVPTATPKTQAMTFPGATSYTTHTTWLAFIK
ncbi:unnamed protein product [Ectocarpus sp. 8 AP-2014]